MDTTTVLPKGLKTTYLRSDLIEGIVLDRQIGAGATSLVFLARDKEDASKQYAVKLLSPFLVLRDEPRHRWEREAELIINLRHPNIVHGIRHGVVENRPYLIMEFLQGETLLDRVGRLGRLPEEEVWKIARASLQALDAANLARVIHRDVKPANMIWTSDGTIKLMDFGLAKSVDDVSVTSTGTIVGTPIYISPEQAAGDTANVSIRSDLYALGSTLFHLAAGRPPFTEINTSLLLTRKITDDVPDIRLVHEAASSPLAFFLLRLCARDQLDRPETPAAALLLLDQLERGELTTSDFKPTPRCSLAPVRPISYDAIPRGNAVLDTIVDEDTIETKPTYLKEGEVLFYEDDTSKEAYVLLSGSVEILKSGRCIATIGEPGSFIGEMSPLNGVPRSATVRAPEQTVLLRISEEEFTSFLSGRPKMALALAQSLAKRLGKTNQDLDDANDRLALVTKHLKELSAALDIV